MKMIRKNGNKFFQRVAAFSCCSVLMLMIYSAGYIDAKKSDSKEVDVSQGSDDDYVYCMSVSPVMIGNQNTQKMSVSSYFNNVQSECERVPVYLYMTNADEVPSSDSPYKPALQLLWDARHLLRFLEGLHVGDEELKRNMLDRRIKHLDDVCSWKGVTCGVMYKKEKVTSSTYSKNGWKVISEFRCLDCLLSGNLGDAMALAFLPYLQVLDLSKNDLTGDFPREAFSAFPMIRDLSLGSNSLTGTLPQAFRKENEELNGKLLNLNEAIIETVEMNHDMIGQVTSTSQPLDFSGLNRLLVERHNLMNKHMAEGFTVLTKLNLFDNEFEGSITRTFTDIPSIEHLDMSGNYFEGTLEHSINMPMVKYLSLSNNKLSGSFPFSSMKTPMLEFLDLSANRFTGNLPSSSNATPYLWSLNLNSNKISGDIPEWIPDQMNEIDFSDNRFTSQPSNLLTALCPAGTFAPNGTAGRWGKCADCPKANNDYIGQTTCEGVDYKFGESDESFRLSVKEFLWYIFDKMGIPHNKRVDPCKYAGIKCYNQKVVSVDLTARVDCALLPEFGYLPDLEYLRLRGISGTLPSELGSLGKLKYIYISHNELTGTIPSAFFANWMSIKQIDMSKNSFSGTLPNMNAISSIESINLSENSLEELGNFVSLKDIKFSNNLLRGTIPNLSAIKGLTSLSLQHNEISGTIPTWLGSFRTLQKIELNNNNIHGTICTELVDLAFLQFLNISHNQITGTFPRPLATVPLLNRIDVSHNQMTGEIPKELGINQRMISLNMSENKFQGKIPDHLCKMRLNLGLTLRYGCDGILCAPGTFNEENGFGSCRPCPKGTGTSYLGSKQCMNFSEQEQLTLLYKRMGGNDWDSKWSSSWNEKNDKCDWYGVECDENGHVISLAIPAYSSQR